MSGCSIGSAGQAATDPIRHVVIVVKENHSFDNYFGSLESPRSELPECSSFTVQIACQYGRNDIPKYYGYASRFGYADGYFTDVSGPSWPNDMMMIAAQSPLVGDPPPPVRDWTCPTYCYDLETIGDRLDAAGVTWRNYGEDLYDPFRSIRLYADDHVHNVGVTKLFDDLQSAGLPSVSWVRPSAADSEHPGYDIRQGEQWTERVVQAIMQSRYWASTAILVTWDDAGDVRDHVVPPLVERTADGRRLRYGDRVPLLVISPFTPAGTVVHDVLSHVSLLKFIEGSFHLQPLTWRDQTARGLDSFFDFSMAPRSP